MDAGQRKTIKENCCRLQENINFSKLIPYISEYKIFNRYMWEDMRSVSDLLSILPTRGPEAFHKFIEILKKANYNTEADLLEKVSLTSESPDEHFYKMSTVPLGYCLIINNIEFKISNPTYCQADALENRYGSEVDAKSLKDFFERAGFEVEVESNLTTDQMKRCLRNFSEKDFTKVDSMILIIMSHGGHLNNREMLYGTDGGFLYKYDIYNIFDNKNCKKLQPKPKVFFFIACRGTGKDYGVEVKESFDSIPVENFTGSTLSNVLIINSSLPYKVTVRDHEKGTYFCQALVSVLNENYMFHDLETMIKLVGKKLEGKVSELLRIIPAAPTTETYVWKRKIMFCRKE